MDKELVKFIRNLFGMTQNDFGKQLGFSRTYVMMIECGYRAISKRYEDQIMRTFNLSVEDIIKYKELKHSVRNAI